MFATHTPSSAIYLIIAPIPYILLNLRGNFKHSLGLAIALLLLRENGISIIYARVYDRGQDRNIGYGSDNPDLEEAARNIYLFKEAERAE